MDQGLKANEWVNSVTGLMQGKGGGKAESAQASGPNFQCIKQALDVAVDFAISKLSGPVSEAIEPASETLVNGVISSHKGAQLKCRLNSLTHIRTKIIAKYSDKNIDFVNNTGTIFTDCDVSLFNVNGILFYLSNPQLKGDNNVFSESSILQWMSYTDNHISPFVGSWVNPCTGAGESPIAIQSAKQETLKSLQYLNNFLLTKTYLVGERISLADIVVFTSLLPAYISVLDLSVRKSFPNLNRWFLTILNQENVKHVIGDVVLCEKAAQTQKQKSKK